MREYPEGLLERICNFAILEKGPPPYPPASISQIEAAESRLGFMLPLLLRSLYLEVGNGGFGPAYGIVGLEGGAESDHGYLVELHEGLKRGLELDGKQWKHGLLPFCEFGCNIYACVDCVGEKSFIYLRECSDLWPQTYDLVQFFELWFCGVDYLDLDQVNVEIAEIEGISPLSGERVKFYSRNRRPKSS